MSGLTAGDVATFVAALITAWVVGFTGGFLMTKFRDAMRMSV